MLLQEAQAKALAQRQDQVGVQTATGISSSQTTVTQSSSNLDQRFLNNPINPNVTQMSSFNPVPYASTSPRISSPQTNAIQQGTQLLQSSFSQNQTSQSSYTLPMNNGNINQRTIVRSNTNPSLLSAFNPNQIKSSYTNTSSVNNINSQILSTNMNINQSHIMTANSNNPIHQSLTNNPTTVNVNHDQVLQQILNTNMSGNRLPSTLNRPAVPSNMAPSIRMTNPSTVSNALRPSLSSQNLSQLTSFVPIASATPSSTVQVQQSQNLTSNRNLVNNNTPQSVGIPRTTLIPHSQIQTVSSNPIGPANGPRLTTDVGRIINPDEDTQSLIKLFTESVARVQIVVDKLKLDGTQTAKAVQVEQILQKMKSFINNPTYESLSTARHIREILKRGANQSNANSNSATTTAATATNSTMIKVENTVPAAVLAPTSVSSMTSTRLPAKSQLIAASPSNNSAVVVTLATTTIPTVSSIPTRTITTNQPIVVPTPVTSTISVAPTITMTTTTTITTPPSVKMNTTPTQVTGTVGSAGSAHSITRPQTTVFSQFSKAFSEFLQHDRQARATVVKRCLEPLSDVINGVPHKMLRLDVDRFSKLRIRSSHRNSSFFSILNDEFNQLPAGLFAIEPTVTTKTKRISPDQFDDEFHQISGILLHCRLLNKSNPLIPSIRMHISGQYPQQAPEILSLTKTTPPRLDFAEANHFFEKISSIFVAHLFKLPSEHTVTDILNIWHQSVETATCNISN